MVLSMPRPFKRKGSAVYQYRQRLPKAVLGRVGGHVLSLPIGDDIVPVTIGERASEFVVSLRTTDRAEAKLRAARVEAYVGAAWSAAQSGPSRLSHKQAVALSGEIYRDFVGSLEDDPGAAQVWADVLATNADVGAGRFGLGAIFSIFPNEEARTLAALEARYGKFVDLVLSRHALVVDTDSRSRLLKEFARSMTEAADRLKQAAEGDYRPDVVAQRFPAWTPPQPAAGNEPRTASSAGAATSLSALVEGWWQEAKATGLAQSTHESYRNTMAKFVAFLGHDDARRVTADDVVRFKDHRLKEVNPRTGKPVSPKTVKDSDLAGLKAVFGWAVGNRRLASNPAAGITIKLGKKVRTRSKGFTDAEARVILAHALAHRRGPQEMATTAAAKRWVPWLCAYSGARVGEVAQLRRQDVRQEDGRWVMVITPDAGTVKNKEARTVPLHPHLVELGFLAFVESAPTGHLFLKPAADGDVLGPLQGVKNRLTEYAREVVPDPDVAPNHGWRHRFKTVGLEAGIAERVLDAICGHAPRTVGAAYGDVTIKTMAAGIDKLPRYAVNGPGMTDGSTPPGGRSASSSTTTTD